MQLADYPITARNYCTAMSNVIASSQKERNMVRSLAVIGGSAIIRRLVARRPGYRMKMLAEYLENAIKFEKMAADEKDAKLKEHFEKQARAKDYGLNTPSDRQGSC